MEVIEQPHSPFDMNLETICNSYVVRPLNLLNEIQNRNLLANPLWLKLTEAVQMRYVRGFERILMLHHLTFLIRFEQHRLVALKKQLEDSIKLYAESLRIMKVDHPRRWQIEDSLTKLNEWKEAVANRNKHYWELDRQVTEWINIYSAAMRKLF